MQGVEYLVLCGEGFVYTYIHEAGRQADRQLKSVQDDFDLEFIRYLWVRSYVVYLWEGIVFGLEVIHVAIHKLLR